jgi:hypothetical protein
MSLAANAGVTNATHKAAITAIVPTRLMIAILLASPNIRLQSSVAHRTVKIADSTPKPCVMSERL